MAITLPGGAVIPDGADRIPVNGVDHVRVLGTSLDTVVQGKAGRSYVDAADGLLDQRITSQAASTAAALAGKADVAELDSRLAGIASAYDVWLAAGNVGDVDDYLASIRGEQGIEGPYGGTSVTDPQVASYVTSETETAVALAQSFLRGINVDAFGAVGDGVTDDRVAINTAIAAAGAAGVPVRFTAGKTYATDAAVIVPHPTSVIGYGATLRARGAASAFIISSSYVTVEGLTIVGNGAGIYKAAERGILSLGTAENPYIGCHLRDVTVRAFPDTAIRCDWWIDSTITGGLLTDLTYAGIIMQSPQRVRIDGVVVSDIWRHTADQAYGISITDNINTVEGRARDVIVTACNITNNKYWTALSTHGGERISFTNNRVIGCYRGIVYGAGNPTRVVAATDGLVTGNIIDGAGAGGSAGISVVGNTNGLSSTALRSGNLIKNHSIPVETANNGYWMDDIQIAKSDPGFPVPAVAISAESVVDRVTIPPSPMPRRAHITSTIYTASSVSSNRCDARIYVNGSQVAVARRALSGGSLPEALTPIGLAEIPASTTPTVIEIRVAVNTGTGTLSTTTTGGLTSTAVTIARA